MASELSATLFRASWPGLTTPAQVAAAQLRIDALLAPVRKAMLEAAHVPDRGMPRNYAEINAVLASLDPKPKQETVGIEASQSTQGETR